MKKLYTIILLLLVQSIAFSQQKKPVSKKPVTPAKTESQPAKPSPEEQQEVLLKLQKVKEDSLAMVKEIRQKIENEFLEEKLRTQRDEQQKQQRYEEALKQEREANERRLAEQALAEAKKYNNKFGYGIKIGGSMSTVTTSELGGINKVYLPALMYGLFANIPIGKKIALVPEINYISKGQKYKYEDDYDQLKMNYISLPILFKIDVLTTSYYKLYTKLGGYGSYWLNAKLQSEISGESLKSDYVFDNDFEDGFKDNRIDYGASAGLGVGIKIRNSVVHIEGRYDYGLSPIYKVETEPDSYVTPLHRSFNVTMGIQF